MRTTITLDERAYRLARAVAAQRHESVGKVLGDALLGKFDVADTSVGQVVIDQFGFPTVRTGTVITNEDVAKAIAED